MQSATNTGWRIDAVGHGDFRCEYLVSLVRGEADAFATAEVMLGRDGELEVLRVRGEYGTTADEVRGLETWLLEHARYVRDCCVWGPRAVKLPVAS